MSDITTTAKHLKKGSYIFIDQEPYRVTNVTKSKTGRHGSTKVRIEAVGLFDEKKKLIIKPGSAVFDVPIINKSSAQVISVSGNIAQLMDLQDYSTFETTIPEEFKDKLESGKEVSYWKIGNKIVIKDIK
jgi:translation initiation factor 5A